MAKKTEKTAPLLSHPLIGKRVTCDVTADSATKRSAGSLKGTLTSYDGAVLRIDKKWWLTSSILNLKEA